MLSCIHLVLFIFGASLTVLFMQIGTDLVDESLLMIESLQQTVYTQSAQNFSLVYSFPSCLLEIPCLKFILAPFVFLPPLLAFWLTGLGFGDSHLVNLSRCL